MSEYCATCGQSLKQTHREVLNKMKLTMLQRAASNVRSTMVNDFKVRDIAEPAEFKRWNNWQKLRYHGLIAQTAKGKGHWLITRNGWAFLRGEINLPKYVMIKNNHITSRADELIHVKDVYRGSEVIETTFAYFSDDGTPVGYKPVFTTAPTQQVALW